MCFSYSRDALLNIGNQCVNGKVDHRVWNKLKDLKIAKTTHRGCRAGRNKQRQIKTIISDRPLTTDHNSGVCHANLRKIPIVTESKTEPKTWALPKVFLSNPRSLNNKYDEFSTVIQDLDVDIAGVSESWFNDDKPIEHFDINNYELITKSRSHKRGGGVALYAREDLRPQRADISVPDNLEVVWVKVRPERLPRDISVIFYAIIYNPPDGTHENELIEHLLHGFDTIRTNHPHAGVVLFGDINHLDTTQLCSGNDLIQVVDKPTRKDAILDKIITNMQDYYHVPDLYSPIGASDHSSLIWTPKSIRKASNAPCLRVIRPMKQSAIRDFGQWIVNHNWSEVSDKPDTVSKCDAFYETLNQAIDTHFPSKTVKLHNDDKPWMSSYIKSLICERQRVFQKEHRSKRWKRLRNKVKRAIHKAKREYYRTRVQRHKRANPAEWYKQIKIMTNRNKGEANIQPPPQVDPNDLKAVADSINNHFASVSTDLKPLDTSELPAYRPDPNPPPVVQEFEVCEMLLKTKAGKAGGPDGISSRLVREFAHELSKPLADILNKSYEEGVCPPQWKKAVVVPIPKAKPASWDKLRPVSLTDHFAKVAEGFMARWLLEDMEGAVDPNQFGNQKGVSTTHYLIKLVDTLHMNANKPGHLSTVVITDFSKAFDLVDHNILMTKFISLGVRPSVVTWLASFLHGREQCVRYRGHTSGWKTLNGGVPQGTRVGPLGFVAIVNDAAINTPLVTLKYVDDLTLIEPRSRSQHSVLQEHVDNFEQWADLNNMQLNPKKCATMKVSFLKNEPEEQPLTIANEPLKVVDSAKILGVNINDNLKWHTQVSQMVKKANGRLYMLKLLKHFNLPRDDLVTIFSGFVRPSAEHAAPVWHPGLTSEESAALERIQRRACRIIMGRQYTSYDDALKACGLDSMYVRREQLCLSFFNSLMESDRFSDWIPPTRGSVHHRNLRNANKLSIPMCNTKRCMNSPMVYMTKLWNENV